MGIIMSPFSPEEKWSLERLINLTFSNFGQILDLILSSLETTWTSFLINVSWTLTEDVQLLGQRLKTLLFLTHKHQYIFIGSLSTEACGGGGANGDIWTA